MADTPHMRLGDIANEAAADHPDETSALCAELLAAGAEELGVAVAPGAVPRLLAYTEAVAHFPAAVKEFEWRSGFFHAITRREVAAGRPDPCPLHTAALTALGALPAP